ncbi:hypothetical protein BBBOND_0202960 [Babesia bigemina]|uniref:Uncharacterized protein n=1 Tax=Babesia bigemina TaxID=5866 RepID=A0A061D895_BABBI|nr:hypothetical protein BBBOND_0202960 [Babesia bigemina]CDR95139.1 hypothetical protein BBBOND_0202960 [Babesia bigemina]|eukprot:XP_012767325.1 hypothetical protein BBBOND_0202960 [Babesia bigemina]
MVYTSLTDIPRNLKEAIDWLVAVKGTDAEKNVKAMGAAVYELLADKPVGFTDVTALWNVKFATKKFLQQDEIKDMWPVKELSKRYYEFMDKSPEAIAKAPAMVPKSDYENVIKTRGLTAEVIGQNLGEVVEGCEKLLQGIKVPEQYESAYGSEATWDASCAAKPEACAVVFVGIAPMLYTGLGAMWDASHLEMSKKSAGAAKVLQALGFVEPQCRAGMTVSNALRGLRGIDLHILDTLYDLSGFWAFY